MDLRALWGLKRHGGTGHKNGAKNQEGSEGYPFTATEILNRVREEVATRNAMHARGA